MPFIPHTADDIANMLSTVNCQSIKQLFDEIPTSLAQADLQAIPAALSEAEVSRLMTEQAPQLTPGASFIGAGAYEHAIPAVVGEMLRRGGFYTAYTPYQAEASQGSLQLIYEYQSMMTQLMNCEVSNASLYDGATAVAEAVLMALRLKRGKAKRVLVPQTLHPRYREVLATVLQHQDVFLEPLHYDPKTGTTDLEQLAILDTEQLAAVIIPQPNFFGALEDVDALTQFAAQVGAYSIAVVNPMAMALLKEPGSWGEQGADIVCGEGQPLGVSLSSGGPYFGFVCCREKEVRQLPGRLVGETVDQQGRRGFTLTLQAREQHIRRAKATSNICTNQGLMVVAATVYMSVLGAAGLHRVATVSHQRAYQLRELLSTIAGTEIIFSAPCFHEFVLRLPKPVNTVLAELSKQDIQGGYDLSKDYPELGNALLICATETKTKPDLIRYQQHLAQCLQSGEG